MPRLSKPTVLFLHGAGGGAWEWNIWIRVFKAHGFHCHAPDLLPSASGLARTSLEDYSQQVKQHLLAMDSPRLIVAASLGGLLALMNSKLADAMALINPMPSAPWHEYMPTRENYPAIIPWQLDASLSGTRRALFDSDEMTCLYAFRHWRNESGAAMNEAMRGIDVARLECPLLVMASEQDKDVPFPVTRNLAENMNASFIQLPDTSHVGPLLGKNAARCALETVAFLNSRFR